MSQIGFRAKLCVKKTIFDSSIQAQSPGGFMSQKWRIYGLSNNFAYSYMNGSNQTAVLQNTTVNVDPMGGTNAWAYSYDSKNHLTQAVKRQYLLLFVTTKAGGFLDSSTGLYKYGIRYYDPTIGH